MSKKFQLYALNPRLRNVNECKVEDILHIRAGTEFKFKSGPFNGQIATILKEPTTQISSSDHLVEIILNNKLDSKLIIPLHQYSIEYLKFASQIFSPEIMIPNHDVFKVEYSNIREVNNQIIYEISKNNKYLDFLHPSAFEDLVGKLYMSFGFEINRVGRWNQADGGVDILAVKKCTSMGDFKIALQCKHSKNKIQPRIIRELNGVLDTQEALKGIVITSSYFTKNTLKETQNNFYRIELKDRDFLIKSLDEFFK